MNANLLDIPVTADHDTIREAYKRLAFANHPDRAVNEQDRKERTAHFQTINEANYVLSNDQRVLLTPNTDGANF
jgi:curved DNA-binding protein CbpA